MDSTAPRTGRQPASLGRIQKIGGLTVLLLPALLISMDVSILFIASPAISADLAPSASQWLWMLDSYSFVVAALLVTMGSLADWIGRRRLLMIGAIAFAAASIALALAPTAELFIVGRVLLGVGAATLAPSTFAIIRDMFTDPTARRRAIAAWTIAYTGGAVAGPVLGGLLLSQFEWPAVFLINLPVMALLLLVGPFVLPESKNSQGARFDLLGAGLSLVAMFGIVYSVKHLAEHGLDLTAGTALMGGVLMLVAFIQRQRTANHPLIDIGLFRNGAFSGAAVANILASLAMVGLGALAFTYLQSVHDLTALQAALYALPTFMGTAGGASLASELAKHIRPGSIVVAGFLIAAVAFAFIGATGTAESLWWFIGGYVVLTFGVGMVSALANSLILTTAPANRAGAAASISETGVQLGGAIGIAAFGLISTVMYRQEMAEDSGAIPAAALDSLAGAEAIAVNLPAGDAQPLLNLAADAFASSVSTVAFIIAAVAMTAAALSAVLLRRVPVNATTDNHSEAD